MTKLTENIWIGCSADEWHVKSHLDKTDAVLNVAHDLQPTRGWLDGVEYMHVGLIDGPGNSTAAYCAAVLALVSLIKKGKRVLVCCHDGGRSLAVSIMYLHLTNGRGWDGWLTLLRERIDGELPVSHEAHKAAFDKMNWRLLTSVQGE